MTSDDGIIGLIIGSPLPVYQNLQPAQQQTVQNIQNLGSQAITLADPTLVEVVVAIIAAIGGFAGLIILLERR